LRCRCIQADYNGRSTLHLAVSENRTEIVKVLLDKGASTEQQDIWGCTPLLESLSGHRTPIAEALISKGAHLDLSMHSSLSWKNAPPHVGCITSDPHTSHIQCTLECSLAALRSVCPEGYRDTERERESWCLRVIKVCSLRAAGQHPRVHYICDVSRSEVQ
jgi:hypothetical protein